MRDMLHTEGQQPLRGTALRLTILHSGGAFLRCCYMVYLPVGNFDGSILGQDWSLSASNDRVEIVAFFGMQFII